MQIDPCLVASPCSGIHLSDGGHHFLKMKLTSTLWFLHLCWHFILLPWNPSSLITVNVFSKRSSINRTTRHCAELLFSFQRPFPVSSSKLPFKTRVDIANTGSRFEQQTTDVVKYPELLYVSFICKTIEL